MIGVYIELRAREPVAPVDQRALEYLLHGGDLVGGRDAGRCVFTHDPAAYCAVANELHDVDADATGEAVEEIAHAAAGEVDTRRERCSAHALDASQRLDQEVEILWLGRREAEAAVADDDRGDTMPARWGARWLEHELCVEVRVDVDEARRQHQAVGVDLVQ